MGGVEDRAGTAGVIASVALGVALLVTPASLAAPPRAQNPQPDPAAEPAEPEPAASSGAPELAPRHRLWLERVAPWISDEEREFFLALERDFRRDAFIERFWQVRDPEPLTPRSELEMRWSERIDQVLLEFGSLEDERAQVYLLNGEPGRYLLVDGREVGRCLHKSLELEVWFYGGSDRTHEWFGLIFYRPAFRASGPYRLWRRDETLRPDRHRRLPTTRAADLCAEELMPGLMRSINEDFPHYLDLLETILRPPQPDSKEWVSTFAAGLAQLPPDAETFPVSLELDFPGRRQSRTAVRGILSVPGAEPATFPAGGAQAVNLQLTGEVVRDDRLFESFRYRFEMRRPAGVEVIPLVFQRYLRPGEVEIYVKLEDLFGGRFAQAHRRFEVPEPGQRPVLDGPRTELFGLFAEAAEAASVGDRTIRILPPPEDEVQVGLVRFHTVTSGELAEVRFLLDGRLVLTKRRPPFSVELDLGPNAAMHRLRAVAYDGDSSEVAFDEIALNRGGQRFRVRLVEPRTDRDYRRSLSAVVQVDVPDGSELDRVELFLGEERVATLYQQPFVQPLLLAGEAMTYVRAVAYLTDGNATEDVVFINAPDYFDQVEVRYVELYASVVDRQGRPVLELERDAFTVREDGEEQQIRRFEYVRDLPIHAGILLDASASMEDSLEQVTDAALAFAEDAVEAKDRIVLIPFNHRPTLGVRFTNRTEEIARELAALRAMGGTALYDSLVFALQYFDGIKGQRALLLLSDGEDESSRFDLEGALEMARRAGVTVYVIGLEEVARERTARKVLRRIADETGGRAFFLEDPAGLPGVYAAILEELRAQYLIAYQSTSTRDAAEFRRVEVEVAQRGAEVRTLSGYYP